MLIIFCSISGLRCGATGNMHSRNKGFPGLFVQHLSAKKRLCDNLFYKYSTEPAVICTWEGLFHMWLQEVRWAVITQVLRNIITYSRFNFFLYGYVQKNVLGVSGVSNQTSGMSHMLLSAKFNSPGLACISWH